MKYQIVQTEYELIEKNIKLEMRKATKDAIGYDEWDGETICYEATKNGTFWRHSC